MERPGHPVELDGAARDLLLPLRRHAIVHARGVRNRQGTVFPTATGVKESKPRGGRANSSIPGDLATAGQTGKLPCVTQAGRDTAHLEGNP